MADELINEISESELGSAKLYYPEGNLKYEGEVWKMLPDGRGVEYYPNGQVLYEGDFCSGTFDGEGAKYYPSGELHYEGSFGYNRYEGSGKMFYKDGSVRFEGIFKRGKFDYGEEYVVEKLVYRGTYKNNRYSGRGRLYAPDGKIFYMGKFTRGVPDIKGTFYYPDSAIKYIGEVLMGKFDGEGKLYSNDGIPVYSGIFVSNVFHGLGTLYHPNGILKFDGVFKNGKYDFGEEYDESRTLIFFGDYHHGTNIYKKGKLYNDDILVYVGAFNKYGTPNARGIYYHPNGKVKYSGTVDQGKYSINGTLYDTGGMKLYEGGFKNSKFWGLGKLFFSDGTHVRYSGFFKNGLFHGKGKLYDQEGKVIHDGRFCKGKFASGDPVERKRKRFDEECAICYESMPKKRKISSEDLSIFVLECEHEFHEKCIQRWIKKSKTCPTCRHSALDRISYHSVPEGNT